MRRGARLGPLYLGFREEHLAVLLEVAHLKRGDPIELVWDGCRPTSPPRCASFGDLAEHDGVPGGEGPGVAGVIETCGM